MKIQTQTTESYNPRLRRQHKAALLLRGKGGECVGYLEAPSAGRHEDTLKWAEWKAIDYIHHENVVCIEVHNNGVWIANITFDRERPYVKELPANHSVPVVTYAGRKWSIEITGYGLAFVGEWRSDLMLIYNGKWCCDAPGALPAYIKRAADRLARRYGDSNEIYKAFHIYNYIR